MDAQVDNYSKDQSRSRHSDEQRAGKRLDRIGLRSFL
jgi:hypothetical protein